MREGCEVGNARTAGFGLVAGVGLEFDQLGIDQPARRAAFEAGSAAGPSAGGSAGESAGGSAGGSVARGPGGSAGVGADRRAGARGRSIGSPCGSGSKYSSSIGAAVPLQPQLELHGQVT